MPDVTTPTAEERGAAEEAALPPEETPETPIQPEQGSEGAEQAPKEGEETAEAEVPADDSAEQLRAQIAAKDAEIERLRAGGDQPKPEAPAPQDGGLRHIGNFVHQVVPQAKKAFADPETPLDRQFDIMLDTADKMLGAVMEDRVLPSINKLAIANIVLANELEIRDLRADNPDFKKQYEPQVKEELAKLEMKERGKPDVAKKIYYRILGEKNGHGKPATPVSNGKARASAPSATLRDVSAGSPASAQKSNGIRLSKEQEAERQTDAQETGQLMSPESYLAKLKARQDRARALGRKVPQTLREL